MQQNDTFKNAPIIVANGEIATHPYAIALLQNASEIICCDGAVDKLCAMGFQPTLIIGDCDSISPESLQKFKEIVQIDRDVEINDLQKSIRYCMNRQQKAACIIGGFGLREDHAIANLSILLMYGKRINLRMVTNHGIFTPIYSTTSFGAYSGQQISIFSFNKETKLTFRNLKYPVTERHFDYFWEGSLNESLGDSFEIILHNAGEVIVYQDFTNKI
jgi:thiamine pyrophosphokinase